MARYGTKEYWQKEVAKAEAKVELLTYAVIKKVGGMSVDIKKADVLNTICHTYTEAYADLEVARRACLEHCADENGSEEST